MRRPLRHALGLSALLVTIVNPCSGDARADQTVIDAAGNLYSSVRTSHYLWKKLGLFGAATTFAGAPNVPGYVDSTCLASRFNSPRDLAIDLATARLYVSDSGNRVVRRIAYNNCNGAAPVRTVATAAHAQAALPGQVSSFGPTGIAVDELGNLYIADNINKVIWYFHTATSRLVLVAGKPLVPGFADGTGTAARFNNPLGMVLFSGGGGVSVQDVNNQGCGVVRQITRGGQVLTISNSTCPPPAQ